MQNYSCSQSRNLSPQSSVEAEEVVSNSGQIYLKQPRTQDLSISSFRNPGIIKTETLKNTCVLKRKWKIAFAPKSLTGYIFCTMSNYE
jgi:hypothetical protein